MAAYPQAERIYAIQDNWSIHKHPDVVAALQQWPQIEPVCHRKIHRGEYDGLRLTDLAYRIGP